MTEPAAEPREGEEWLRLSWRMLAVNLKWLLPPAFSAAVYAMFTGGRLDKDAIIRLGVITGIFLLISLAETIQLLTTRFRVTDERFEVRTGLFTRKQRSIPRDRIRRVDVTASPIHRIFRLSVLRIGTGQQAVGGDEEIKLAALAKEDAARLREGLLIRSPVAGQESRDGLIAELNWSWLRYSPLTIWGVLGIAIIGGVGIRSLDVFGIKPKDVFDAVGRFIGDIALWKTLLLLGGGLIVLGILGCLVAFAEEWWKYRFERDEDGAFRVQRGLLTTRSLSLDRRRLRGVELVEPLLMRMGGAARVHLIATGMNAENGTSGDLKTVTPAIPRAEAQEVAAQIVDEHPAPTTSENLIAHPKAARRRRFVRASLGVVIPLGALAVVGAFVLPELVTAAWISALVLWPVALVLAAGAYRALGHAIAGDYLITRYGAVDRRTVALQREGVIGWKIERSPTQRFAGLATLSAVTAAGNGHAYLIRDTSTGEAVRVADEALPGLLTPFLRRPERARAEAEPKVREPAGHARE
ncbi:PH domain-containing protein [Amycolatopsis sp. CA-230715]|uniref:PH domain-containing protein n=1 Tax=Amycolatopsis sp. CA-230715 TaxID=2745196 RepID=UPI001C02D530|nr:PH domain-containing protein [Amycolatopsis sp. CA-230715]QWF78561.1 hypothetical protein HUW46_01957 [Amycolatopsis sp. CA-230715]